MQQTALTQWAHDIRNALGTVAIYVDMLKRQTASRNDDLPDLAQVVLARASAMCDALVRQADHHEARTRRSSLDIAEIIEQVRDLIGPTLPADGLLQIAVDGPIRVMADAQDAFRVLFNLVDNAAAIARRSTALRRIRIAAACTGTMARIIIADDGPGLPETVRSRLFRPDRSETGRGHGLAIARELAERNGGIVTLVGVASGTTFMIELPLAAADRAAA